MRQSIDNLMTSWYDQGIASVERKELCSIVSLMTISVQPSSNTLIFQSTRQDGTCQARRLLRTWSSRESFLAAPAGRRKCAYLQRYNIWVYRRFAPRHGVAIPAFGHATPQTNDNPFGFLTLRNDPMTTRLSWHDNLVWALLCPNDDLTTKNRSKDYILFYSF